MQQHLARAPVDHEVGERHVHRRVVVPGLARRGLVVPGVCARVGVDRYDRAQEQIVAAARAAQSRIPGATIARPQVEAIEFRVVGHGVPDGAAAAPLPPPPAPGARGHLHRRVLESARGIARYGPEAPELLAGLRVICGDVASDGTEVAATEADHDLVVEHARRAGDERAIGGINGLHAPDRLAVARVDSQQSTVVCPDEDPLLPVREAADPPARAQLDAGALRDTRVVAPEESAGARIDRMDDAVADREIDHAVDGERRRQHVLRLEVETPGEPEPADVAGVDLLERAVVRLVEGAPVGRPVATVGDIVQKRSSIVAGASARSAVAMHSPRTPRTQTPPRMLRSRRVYIDARPIDTFPVSKCPRSPGRRTRSIGNRVSSPDEPGVTTRCAS